MPSSTNGTSYLCKCYVKGEFMGSRLIGYMCNLPIKRKSCVHRIFCNSLAYLMYTGPHPVYMRWSGSSNKIYYL